MEVRQVRTEEIKLQKEDQPAPNIRYYGRSDDITANDATPIWQILREYRVGDITTIEYANKGSFNCRWDQRTSYFGPAIPDASVPVTGTVIVKGLSKEGRITVISINDTGWTKLPTGANLTDRNQLNIQNTAAVDIEIQYADKALLPAPYGTGVVLGSGAERQYGITESIDLYARSSLGTVSIRIEELA